MSAVPSPAPTEKASRRWSAVTWLWSRRFALVYVALGAWFILHVARFHDAQTGFAPMVLFGDRFASERLTRLRDVPLYTYRNSAGYDGQFYAQIAVAGNPFDPELRTALDSPAYRTGRILLPVIAHVAGFGRPTLVLAAYALSNVVCWLLLAWATARWWFPPTSVDNLLRWIGTMFGAGMLVSVSRSLTDAPALLFVATGVRCIEMNRGRLGASLLAAAGLVREMSVLAAAAFVRPISRGRSAWRRDLLSACACVLPAVIWFGVLSVHYGAASKGGLGALGFPLVALIDKCKAIASTVQTAGLNDAQDDIYVVAAVLVQVAFVLGRPRPALPWWRVGAAFAVLALFLGVGHWEDAPMAVPRTLLPLTLAFNVLAPRTGAGLALILAGNLTVLSSSRTFDPFGSEQTTFAEELTCDFASGWHGPEHLGMRTWRWSSGSALLTFHNPAARPIPIVIDFALLTRTDRTVVVSADGVSQSVTLKGSHGVPVHFGPVELQPGDTAVAFETSEPAWAEPGPHGRPLAFSLQNLRVTVVPTPVESR
ncbi:MAG: hypothetical protein M3O46_21350 [Myxococcota bacterium]|nr:hypothetical protein [Myxococcota bacterium]